MISDQKKGAPPCGLYLVLPQDWIKPEFLAKFRDLFRAINSSAYEKNSHVIELRLEAGKEYTADQNDIVGALAELARSQGIIFIVGNDIALARSSGADGVLLDNADLFDTAHATLGPESIIGLQCGESRRQAEKALVLGADFVSFHSPIGFVNPGLIEWWHYKTDNPCLVEGRMTNDDCAVYVRAGADFIDASTYVWGHSEGVMKGVVNMMYAIDLALDHQAEEKSA